QPLSQVSAIISDHFQWIQHLICAGCTFIYARWTFTLFDGRHIAPADASRSKRPRIRGRALLENRRGAGNLARSRLSGGSWAMSEPSWPVEGRLKAGCSQDWLPHKAAHIFIIRCDAHARIQTSWPGRDGILNHSRANGESGMRGTPC